MYEELRDRNFEIVAVAEDTAGEEAAGPFYDAAKATYTTLLDTRHTVSALFNLVNVPTGVLIDENGTVVRLDEGTYTRTYQAGSLSFGTDEYVPALRDWVENGASSRYARAAREMAERLPRRDAQQAQAEAHFRLGVHFFDEGKHELAESHWQSAQQLHPESWNYHRQEWSFTPGEAGPNWLKKFQGLQGKPYYAPMELPEDPDGR